MASNVTTDEVVKQIYTACDTENTNQVPVSKLIEYIKPYVIDNSVAFEVLKVDLGSEDENKCISSDSFCKVMTNWTKKIETSDDVNNSEEFNKQPNQFDVSKDKNDKNLPFTQSTPRASFGQKILSYENLLHLSNVTAQELSLNSSPKDDSTGSGEKQALQEEIKCLECQLNKVVGEMELLKSQLTFMEEQNEILLSDLTRSRTRLANEQQMNEQLQKDKIQNDELQEEINSMKRQTEEMSKKLHQYEKDNCYMSSCIQNLEQENTRLIDVCEKIKKQEKNLKSEFVNLKTELELKDQELQIVTKMNDDLKNALRREKEVIQELTNENNLLDYKKNTLEKRLSYRRYSAPNYCKDSNFSQGTTFIPIYSSPTSKESSKLSFSFNSPSLLDKLQSPLTPILDTPIKRSNSNVLHSLLNRSFPYLTNPQEPARSSPISFYDVKDCSFDEYLFEYELEGLKNSPQVSLHAELLQIKQTDETQEEKGENKMDESHCNKVEDFSELMDSLKLENVMLESKLKNLEDENKEIYLNLSESHKMNESLLKQLEEMKSCIKTTESTSEITKTLSDVNLELMNLKKDYEELQIILESKDKELSEYKNKFDFELVYKDTQKKLNKKIRELEEVKQSLSEFKEIKENLSNCNQNLEKRLKLTELELQKLRNILQTTTKEAMEPFCLDNTGIKQECKIFNKHKETIEELKKDIESKVNDISELRANLKREIEIKNNIWIINRELKIENCKLNKKIHYFGGLDQEINELRAKNNELNENLKDYSKISIQLNELRSECNELNAKIVEYDNANKQIKEEYNNLLLSYNNEVSKNNDLNKQIVEIPNVLDKYNKELNKNIKISKEVDELKNEIETMKNNQMDCQKKFEKTITEYKDIIDKFESNINELEKNKEILKSNLHKEKNLKKEINTKLVEYQEKLRKCDNTIKELKHLNSSLKTEVEETKKISFLENSSFSKTLEKSGVETKNLSFEKQKLTIERLKEKIEHLESQVSVVKSNNDSLTNILEETKNKASCEKHSLQNSIKELSNKLNEQEEYYDELGRASNLKIRELSVKVAQLEESNRNVQSELNEKTLLLKKQHEAKDLTNAFIKNLNENLVKEKNQNQYLLSELKNKGDLFNTLKDQNEKFKSLNESLEKQILELSLTVDQQKQTLINNKEEIQMLKDRLQEKDNAIDVLRNNLSDLICKSLKHNDAHKALLETNKKLQDRLSKTDDRKEEELKEYEGFKLKISLQTDILLHCLKELYRGITVIKDKWQQELEKSIKYNEMMPIDDKLPTDLEEQIFCLAERVSTLMTLLEILITQSSTQMEEFENFETLHLSTQGIQKPLKKFTCPSRFIMGRPVSPDSPSLEISSQLEKTCGDNVLIKKESVSDSPDSQFSGNDIRNEFTVDLESRSSSQLLLPIQLPFDDAFPHLTDSFLEKIGLHEDSAKQILTKEETENMFTEFVIHLALDMQDVKERLENQRTQCQNNQRKCLYLIKDISVRLREHKCIGAVDSINPIFVLLEDVRFLLQEIIQSAGQLGVLSSENRMKRCWNLVTNYMAMLKKDVSSSPKRKTSVDKEVNATVYEENLLTKELSTENISLEDETINTVVDNRNENGYSYYDCFQYTEKIITWVLILMVLAFIILISVHWQCQMVPENVMCPLDEFIRKVHIGTPPH